ncbi:mitochondrial FAD-linked sulfhydryl oxidase [Nematocida homosporus]|uniref:mitochondrial FAD-linked sulfhydryl oxidase n=1 Tax=Nematocida homosporus TaxID=1912981 RepID=UPI002220A21E|nr:mitochondrial FAD-linked sulfhydryl oxidase [Nematocida homosporus]KAI5184333.1 mitochondrial FAD-linked sulfhydryl oxidase [Nematocida homosporus]
MRKEVLLQRAGLGLLSLWILLTGYKVTRKYFHTPTLFPAKLTTPNDQYYTMPPTKAERRNELGRSTWTLLHTIAAKYPAYPSREEKSNAIKLIDLLTKMFPCDECRTHFQALVRSFPPQVNTQEEFATWLCQAHNIVNKRLNKPVFDCTRLDNRWDCGCK